MKFKTGDIIVCISPKFFGDEDYRLNLKVEGYYKVRETNGDIIYISDFKNYGTNETYGYYENRFEDHIKYERKLRLKKLNELR